MQDTVVIETGVATYTLLKPIKIWLYILFLSTNYESMGINMSRS